MNNVATIPALGVFVQTFADVVNLLPEDKQKIVVAAWVFEALIEAIGTGNWETVDRDYVVAEAIRLIEVRLMEETL